MFVLTCPHLSAANSASDLRVYMITSAQDRVPKTRFSKVQTQYRPPRNRRSDGLRFSLFRRSAHSFPSDSLKLVIASLIEATHPPSRAGRRALATA